jgi:hypothetical protein
MSLYVNAENQKLLWKVIHNHPLASQFFSRLTPNQKTEWFKSIIKGFYEQNANRIISIQDLQQLNKATIAYMAQTMKPNVIQPTVQNYTEDPPRNTKEMVFNQQFDMKKREYESLLEKKAPETIDFREKMEDTAISNMSDLIQTHIREREEELKQYSQQSNIIPQSKPITKTHRLKIDKNADINNETLNAQVLENEEKRPKKYVTWMTDNAESRSMLEEDFEAFKIDIREQIKLLQDQVNELRNFTTVNL